MIRYGTVWYGMVWYGMVLETHDYLDKLPKDSRPKKMRVSFQINDEDIVIGDIRHTADVLLLKLEILP